MKPTLPFALAACASGPAFGPDELASVRVFQDAVRAVQRCTDAELFTERLLFTLPAGLELQDIDLHGRTGIGGDYGSGGLGSVVVCFDGALTLIHWRNGVHHPALLHGEFACYDTEEADGTEFLACGGRALRGFDEVLRYTVHGQDGIVLAGVRHGTPCLVASDQVEDRSLFVPSYRPALSFDGSRIAYARWHLFGSRPVWAATAAPHRCEPLTFPGLMNWPPALSSDGSRWAATVQHGSDSCAVENGEVVARCEHLEGPWFEHDGDVFVWKGGAAGQRRRLVGRTLTEPFDQVTWPKFIPGGSWFVLGYDAQGTHLVVDGQRVASQGPGANAVRAASGQTWAWQLRAADGIRVVHGERTYGPYPEQPGVASLTLSGDGRTIAFQLGVAGPWLVDGERTSADFERAEHLQLLDGGGCVYEGMRRVQDALEYWLVTPAGRYGPWDGIGGRKLSADGKQIAFAAWRGREVWRKVVPVR